MGILSDTQTYEPQGAVSRGHLLHSIHRPQANNTIDDRLIEEFAEVLDLCEAESRSQRKACRKPLLRRRFQGHPANLEGASRNSW
jgi:hypothetical protein